MLYFAIFCLFRRSFNTKNIRAPAFSYYFCSVMKKSLLKITRTAALFLRAHAAWLGLPLVYTGVLLMACFYATGLTDHNAFLLFPLALIVLGIADHVRNEKTSGKY